MQSLSADAQSDAVRSAKNVARAQQESLEAEIAQLRRSTIAKDTHEQIVAAKVAEASAQVRHELTQDTAKQVCPLRFVMYVHTRAQRQCVSPGERS